MMTLSNYSGVIEMATVEGVIEVKNYKEEWDKHSIKVNGSWFNTKYPIAAEVGDSVIFDSGPSGKMVKGLKKTASGGGVSAAATSAAPAPAKAAPPAFPVSTTSNDRRLVRQHSLEFASRMAIELMGKLVTEKTTAKVVAFDDVKKLGETWALFTVDLARYFEDYAAGDEFARELAED